MGNPTMFGEEKSRKMFPSLSEGETDGASSEDESKFELFHARSPHEFEVFPALHLKSTMSFSELIQLCLAVDTDYIVSGSLPWHVKQSCVFVVAVDSLENQNDIGTDCWRWGTNKTLTMSTPDLGDLDLLSTGNIKDQFRVVKRYHTCQTTSAVKRISIAVYPPGVKAVDKKAPFGTCIRNVVLMYLIDDEGNIQPDKKPRTYASTKSRVERELSSGKGAARATFEVEKSRGGLMNTRNASEIPKRSQAYEMNRGKSDARRREDPLFDFVMQQRSGGPDPHPVIRRVAFDDHSYRVVLFSRRVLLNIANYCTTDDKLWKSPLAFDFTFELLKNPPCYALVGSFKNTALFVKGTEKSPVMLGPILLCHKRDEKTIKTLFDVMLEDCPGLGQHVKVLGADGERAISNVALTAFPESILLLCSNHAKKNIKEKLKDLVNTKNLRRLAFNDIFGDGITPGLVHARSMDEFDTLSHTVLAKWKQHGDLKRFATYFERNKLDDFKHFMIKGVVDKVGLVDTPDLFTTNIAESVNSIIKSWNASEKHDINEFVSSYTNMLENQESQVMRACLGLESTYVLRPEFQNHALTLQTFQCMDHDVKTNTKARLLNLEVDSRAFKCVRDYTIGQNALVRARENAMALFLRDHETGTADTQCAPEASPSSASQNQIDDENILLQNTVSAISQVLPRQDPVTVRGAVGKAILVLRNKDLSSSFQPNSYFVTSHHRQLAAHHVQFHQSGRVFCDNQCRAYNSQRYCGHTIAVAIKEDMVQAYATFLSKEIGHENLTKVASQNVSSNCGKKGPTNLQKRLRKKMPSSSSSSSISAFSSGLQVVDMPCITEKATISDTTATTTTTEIPLSAQNVSTELVPSQFAHDTAVSSQTTPTNNEEAEATCSYPGVLQEVSAEVRLAVDTSASISSSPSLLATQRSMHFQQQPISAMFAALSRAAQGSIFYGQHKDIEEGKFVLTQLHVCHSSVSVCYGCDQPLKIGFPDGTKVLPESPNDLVLISKSNREFFCKKSAERRQKVQNCYFHVDSSTGPLSCVRGRLYCLPGNIFLDHKCQPTLDNVHKAFILHRLELIHLEPWL